MVESLTKYAYIIYISCSFTTTDLAEAFLKVGEGVQLHGFSASIALEFGKVACLTKLFHLDGTKQILFYFNGIC